MYCLDEDNLRLLQEVNIDTVMTESEFAGRVHPTILRLGLAYASGAVRGSNARAVALLTALSQMFQVGTLAGGASTRQRLQGIGGCDC